MQKILEKNDKIPFRLLRVKASFAYLRFLFSFSIGDTTSKSRAEHSKQKKNLSVPEKIYIFQPFAFLVKTESSLRNVFLENSFRQQQPAV